MNCNHVKTGQGTVDQYLKLLDLPLHALFNKLTRPSLKLVMIEHAILVEESIILLGGVHLAPSQQRLPATGGANVVHGEGILWRCGWFGWDNLGGNGEAFCYYLQKRVRSRQDKRI